MPTLRKFIQSIVASILFALLLIVAARPLTAPEAIDPYAQVKRMGRGLNILGYDPIWRNFSKRRFQERHFALIHEAGFQTVRINLHGLQRLRARNGYEIDPRWLETLDWVVQKALQNQLLVILDLHNYEDIGRNPTKFRPRFLAYWEQIALHFKDAPDSVLFEILNEPNTNLTPQLWNEFLSRALAIIRISNPTRTVVIGPPYWDSIDHLNDLLLPENDRNIIVTIHYYDPMRFTHQGAPFEKETAHLSGITWGSPEEKQQLREDFAKAQEWSVSHHRPILLGEFGAYDKAPTDSRIAYTAEVARTAESLGWAWTYWQFDSDFIAFDIERNQWVEPIRRALIP